MSSPAIFEPGVFGLFRPALLVPENLVHQLTPQQLDAILAHELCHVRRRDNLAAAIHTAVEAVFWFHPLVWWLGARLIEERERACDEDVLRTGHEPEVYAEGILKICELYLQSPLRCVAGVTGGHLKRRIELIMNNPIRDRLTISRKLLLASVGTVVIAGPLLHGLAEAAQQSGTQSKEPMVSPSEFEVAAVRPSGRHDVDAGTFKSVEGNDQGPDFRVEHRRLTAVNFNLFGLIVKAYGLTSCRPLGGSDCVLLSGGPEWLKKDGFDVVAKAPDDTPDYTLVQLQNGRAPHLQLMLQALLRDRFHLKVHHEQKVVPVYALTARDKRMKLKKADPAEEHMVVFRKSAGLNGREIIHLIVRNGTMQEVVELYSKFMTRPVVDRTGFKAEALDFTLDYEADADGGPFAAITGPGLFRAFQDRGLKLEATKGPVDVLVIDHAERPLIN